MNQNDFVHWLQGVLEFQNIDELSEENAKLILSGIQDHLALVFKKVTPQRKLETVKVGDVVFPGKRDIDQDKKDKEAAEKALTDKWIKEFQERIKRDPPPIEPYIWPRDPDTYPYPDITFPMSPVNPLQPKWIPGQGPMC